MYKIKHLIPWKYFLSNPEYKLNSFKVYILSTFIILKTLSCIKTCPWGKNAYLIKLLKSKSGTMRRNINS